MNGFSLTDVQQRNFKSYIFHSSSSSSSKRVVATKKTKRKEEGYQGGGGGGGGGGGAGKSGIEGGLGERERRIGERRWRG